MILSVFDMYTIGIGPSSSHTVGPMRAARRFVDALDAAGDLARVATVSVELFGSLGHTGKGHGSDVAVVLGLLGDSESDGLTVQVLGTRLIRSRACAARGWLMPPCHRGVWGYGSRKRALRPKPHHPAGCDQPRQEEQPCTLE